MLSERYSYEHEIKAVLKEISDKNGGGPVLWVDPLTKKAYVLDSESNVIFLGLSGAGKTRRGTISMIMAWIVAEESFIVVDPKGDLREATYCYAEKANYDIKTFNLRDIKQSLGFNMLSLPYELYKSGDVSKQQLASEMVDNLAEAIFPHTGENDPFWIDSARSLFTGAIYILFEFGTEEQITIPNVYKLISEGQDKIGGAIYLNKLCDMFPDKTFSMLLKHVCSAPRETLGSINSVTYGGMNFLIKNKGITDMISSNEFKISSLDGTNPVAIYVVTPDETGVYSSISGVIINQITTYLIRLAHDKYSGRLPRRFNLLIEELGNIGKAIPNLDHIMSAGRSRNLRTAIVLQSFSQLQDIYGNSKATTIISNADTLIAYRTNNWETLVEISRKCGEREIDYGIKTAMEPLITPTQLGAMETGQCLCIVSGRVKFISWLPDYTDLFNMKDWTPPITEEHERYVSSSMFKISSVVNDLENESKDTHRRSFSHKESSSNGVSVTFDVDDLVKDLKALESNPEAFIDRFDKECVRTHLESEMKLLDIVNDNSVALPSEVLDEENLFIRILKKRGKSKYYEVKVFRYENLENRTEILIRANRHRMRPIPFEHHGPFSVFFKTKKQADDFISYISEYGCLAILKPKTIELKEE